MSDNTKAIVGTAVAVGAITAAGLAYLYSRNVDEPIPTKWKKVGEIVDLNCFPLKSCAPIKQDSFECHVLGFNCEGVFDRCFAVSHNNKNVTALTYPRMVLIQPKIIGNQLTLSAPDKDDCVLNLDKLRKGVVNAKIQCWHSKVDGIDAGDEVADWLSEHIVGKKGVFRLNFYPHLYSTQKVTKSDRKYKGFKEEDSGTYHDTTSYMLINQASIDDVNTHLDHVVKPLQFRPNLIVKGPAAYEEDAWNWVRVGEHVIFRGLSPCTRCIFTNIDPDTAERNPQREPLETLKKYRTIIPGESPVMGRYLAIRVSGTVRCGDPVYINDERDVQQSK